MLWLWLLAACTKDGDDSDDTESVDAADPAFDMAEDPACEAFTDGGGNQTFIAGATNYFIGELTFFGEDVTGYEQRVMFANDTWVEAVPEAGDCHVTWTIVGIKEETPCASCDYRLSVHATLDRTDTDCIQEFVDFEEPEMDFSYDVALTAEGAATLYFASGTTFATVGGGDDGGLWYQSDSSCKWF